MSDDVRHYKVLGPERMPCHGGDGQWPEPGIWREVSGPLIPCRNGLHVCRGERQLVHWLGPDIWAVEVDGDSVEATDKLVVRRARLVQRYDTWTERAQRLFAADCAERVLPVFELAYPDDDRPRHALAIVRAYATGAATDAELEAAEAAAAAAWSAAAAAAAAAAWAASRDTAVAAAWDEAAAAAKAAAWAVAGDEAAAAAKAAAWAAAKAAAWERERDWQATRLRQYLDGEVG